MDKRIKANSREKKKQNNKKQNGINSSIAVLNGSQSKLSDFSNKGQKITRAANYSSEAQVESSSPVARKQYTWKEDICNQENEGNTRLGRTTFYSNVSTPNYSNLGQNVSNENSLHAVQQQTAEPEKFPSSPQENGPESDEKVEDVELKSPTHSQTNSLLEQLLDSKSNRMLQSINPAAQTLSNKHSYPASPRKIEKVSKSNAPNGIVRKSDDFGSDREENTHSSNTTIPKPNGTARKRSFKDPPKHDEIKPSQSNPSSPCDKSKFTARRASRTVFAGKMEVLEETYCEEEKNPSPTKDYKSKSKQRSVSKSRTSSIVSSSTHDASSGGNSKQTSLHAAVNEDDVTTAIKEASRANKERATRSQEQQQTTPRFLTAVCRNHDGRNSTENQEAVLFCKICVQAVCYKCAFERHKDHDVLPLASAIGLIRTKMSEQKRIIENNISQMRGRRKLMETSSEDVRNRIKTQFGNAIERLREKEEEVMTALEKARQDRFGSLYCIQSQQETSWGQIDAVLKTVDDVKMLEEFSSLSPETIHLGLGLPTSQTAGYSPVILNPKMSVDLCKLQEEIEKIRLHNEEDSRDGETSQSINNDTPRKKKKLMFKLDSSTAGNALRISPNCTAAEYVGSARNSIGHNQSVHIHPPAQGASLSSHSHPYPGVSTVRLRRTQFATVLSDTSITQGKQYWEVSVNRSMEYRVGVAYKHMQGTKTLADDHNSWTLCLTYPDRFSAMHKGRKEYIFVASHIANSTSKVMRIGLYLDFERGILSFYNASTSAEKRHLYTFRTFFNRPVWPLISLRQGKLQIVTGLQIPRNLVWKTR